MRRNFFSFFKKNRKVLLILAVAIIGVLVLSNFTQVQGKISVYQILSDYQDYPNGGDGYLRIMTFDPIKNQIEVSTFSPYLNQYKTGSSSEFNLSYTFTNPPTGTMPPVYLPFTIIVLPDTQYYSKTYPQIYLNQTNWILQNRQALNIQFVIQLGDIVDSYSNMNQWTNAYNALNVLRQNNIPFSVLAGDHDYVSWEPSFNQSNYYYFTQTISYNSQQSFGDSLNNDNFNSYFTFNIGYDKYVILSLSYNPSAAVLVWANNIVQQHPGYKVILATHEFVGSNGRTTIGNNIWNSLVKPNAQQLQIVLCGHFNDEYIYYNSILGINQDEILRTDKV